MTTLAQQFLALSADQKRAIHFDLCRQALDTWREFAATHGKIRYAETVCGTNQVVDAKLPEEAFLSAQSGSDIAGVAERYLEPLAALQDEDLELPSTLQYAYYAIHNLFLKYACRKNIDDWLIVNEALSSESDESQWQSMLRDAIAKAI